ncbi:MAG: pseudouridine synthase [Gammaproteobacteria bacterium]|nr:pseudouridine synthase [Gammaproteobacteria bacterium]
MSRILLLNKPYNVLCQFTDSEGRPTLADYLSEKGLYPAGRLDRDSEGLLLLTDDGALQHCIAHPAAKLEKTYWVQVEGVPDEEALQRLRQGIELKDGTTRPARVERLPPPDIWPRNPPIRYRAAIPDSWLTLTISEGRNRQVRRMTAAIGFPTLRLIRWSIGDWDLDTLTPGQWRELDSDEVANFRQRCMKLKSPRGRRQHHRTETAARCMAKRHNRPGR